MEPPRIKIWLSSPAWGGGGGVELDRPGECSPKSEGLLLTVTDVSTTSVVVIFRVKVSCITSIGGIKLWLLS